MAKPERKKSPINESMLEVEGTTSIGDALPPGSSIPTDIDFEGLGRLTDFPDDPEAATHTDGSGEYVVVLTDYLTGAGEHDYFSKGHVRRISRVIPGYGDKNQEELVKGRIKRLLGLKAIRLATTEEQGQDKVEVTLESESETVTAERNRRIAVEQENAILRQRLGLANDAAVAATPGQAGASAEAQGAAKEPTTPPTTEGDGFDA